MLNRKYPYKKAVLKDRNGDLSKRWYITFQVWHKQKNKLITKYDYEVNKHGDDSSRRRYARKAIKEINAMLEDGMIINDEISTHKKTPLLLEKALYDILEIKKNEYSLGTYNSYHSKVSVFIKFINGYFGENYLVHDLTTNNILGFLDDLARNDRSAKTINYYVDCLKSLYESIKERHPDIPDNPFLNIKRRKELVSTQNLAYNKIEKKLLIGTIKSTDPYLFDFVQFIYYTFMRPNEIRQLQVYNIQLEDNRIFIDAYKSKSKKDAFITIPPTFEPTISRLIKNKSTGEYLFPGKLAACISKNLMSERHRTILKRFEWSHGHTLYSWKHTGVVDAYRNGVDIKSLQLQLRHHSLEETDTYLKSLGMYTNKAILTKMPTLI